MTIKQVILFCGVPMFAGFLCSLPTGATAAELSVYAPGGVRSALQGAAVEFKKKTGHTIKFTFGTGGGIQRQIADGAPADVTVLPSKGISELEKAGFVLPNSRLEVGSVGVGIGIKAGMPQPKIGTMEELRKTLLAAKSITYADPARGGTSGTYFATVVLARLGIAEQMKGKTTLTAVGEDAVRRVVNGESEIVIVQSSEITAVAGADLVGPLPAGIQNAIPYAAVALKSSKNPDVARAFLAFLDSPAGRVAFQKSGFQRAGTR